MSLFDIQKVTVGPQNLTARVRLANGAPVRTAEDIEATNRVYQLLPQIVDHACVSEQGDTFRDALGDTELAHLLEHVAVELMTRLDMEDISAGNTVATDEDRVWEIALSCPNDVLVMGALTTAEWIMEWAFTGGEGSQPDIEHTVEAMRRLGESLPEVAKREA